MDTETTKLLQNVQDFKSETKKLKFNMLKFLLLKTLCFSTFGKNNLQLYNTFFL